MLHYSLLIFYAMTAADGHGRMTAYLSNRSDQREKKAARHIPENKGRKEGRFFSFDTAQKSALTCALYESW